MHPVIPYSVFFLALGAAGMAYGSRHAAAEVKRSRWLKYFMYILITSIVLTSIFFHFFIAVAVFILLAGLLELLRASFGHMDARAYMTHVGQQGKGTISKEVKRTAGPGQKATALSAYAILSVLFISFATFIPVQLQVYVFFQVLVFDGFCQITGQIMGRHALAPRISPAKTVEGLAGGWLFCILTARMTADWVSFSPVKALLAGWVTGLAAFAGDMLASWYKRMTGIKDYSNWLPGQGGFLDRYDSFIMAGTVCYLLQVMTGFYF